MWETLEDFEDGTALHTLAQLKEDRHLTVLLIDGSARTRLHVNMICDDVLKNDESLYCMPSLLFSPPPLLIMPCSGAGVWGFSTCE